MLPLIVSYIAPGEEYGEKVRHLMETRAKFWPYLARFAKPGFALGFIIFCVCLGAVALYESRDRQIGDVHAGVGELWPNARYNTDSEYIAEHFKLGLNVMNVIV